MALSRSVLLLVVIYFAAQANASTFISKNLVNYIKQNSDPDVIPQTTLTTPVSVSVGLILNNIREVDYETKDVVVDAWLNLKWNSGITFNPDDFGGLSAVRVPASAIWRPDMEVYNGRMSYPGDMLTNQVQMSSDGSVIWVPKVDIRVSCDFTRPLIYFATVCQVKMGSWVYSGNFITLDNNPSFDISTYATFGSSFEILNTTAQKDTEHYACCPESYEDTKFFFTFKKKSFF